MTIGATGTLDGKNGGTIEYTKDDPLEYSFTLTEAQLREAYDDCPNSEGYDIAINLSDVAKVAVDTSDQIILYKVWDDDSDPQGIRAEVESVRVTLERSTDGETWEPVRSLTDTSVEEPATFEIKKVEDQDEDPDRWSLVLTSEDVDLTYEVENGDGTTGTAYYQFRIASEEAVIVDHEVERYTYTDTINGMTVTNSLTQDTISISGKKEWDFGENGDETEEPPVDSVIIAVYQDDCFYEMKEVSEKDNWEFSFDGLPKYSGDMSTKYVYTFRELNENGNSVESGGSILLNGTGYKVTVTVGDDGDYIVTNSKGGDGESELPKTGGVGRIPFTLAGLALIGGSGCLLIRRRRAVVRDG